MTDTDRNDKNPAAEQAVKSLRNIQLVGMLVIALLILGCGGWAAWASINGAVIASATVVVESNSKKVQHFEGGVVSEIYVKEGERIEAGKLLLRLDQTETEAGLAIVNARLNELMANRARLRAERDETGEVLFPEELIKKNSDREIQNILNGQEKLFAARRKALKGKKEQLGKQVSQLKQEIIGLKAQQVSKEKQIRLIGDELEGLRTLREKKLVPTSRLLALEREEAKLEGERGSLIAEIARARGKISETELNIIQVDQEARTEVLTELREVETNLAEYLERRTASEMRLKRTEIRAPKTGIVHQMAVHTIGGVITASEPVMLIVPERDTLVLEAQVDPAKIDQVELNQKAVVRFAAFDQRNTPELNGKVIRVSADLTRIDVNTPPYYTVRVELSAQELKRLGNRKLRPGMPAEVFIQTGARSALSYLLKPLTDQIARTFRER